MPDHCQKPTGGCHLPPTVRIEYQTAPVKAPGGPLPGMTWIESFCRVDGAARIAQIIDEGGSIVRQEELPPPPTPLMPEPVGLDAIDPAGAASDGGPA